MKRTISFATIISAIVLCASLAFATGGHGDLTWAEAYSASIAFSKSKSKSNSSSSVNNHLTFRDEGDDIPFALLPLSHGGVPRGTTGKVPITSLSLPLVVGGTEITTLADTYMETMKLISEGNYYIWIGPLLYKVRVVAMVTYEGDTRGLIANPEYAEQVLKNAAKNAALNAPEYKKLYVGMSSWKTSDVKTKSLVGGGTSGVPGNYTGGASIGPSVSSERSAMNIIGYVLAPIIGPIDIEGTVCKLFPARINELAELAAKCHKLSRNNGELRKEIMILILRYLRCLEKDGFQPNVKSMIDGAFVQAMQARRNFLHIGHYDRELDLFIAYLSGIRQDIPSKKAALKRAGKSNWKDQELDNWIQGELDKEPKTAASFAQYSKSSVTKPPVVEKKESSKPVSTKPRTQKTSKYGPDYHSLSPEEKRIRRFLIDE